MKTKIILCLLIFVTNVNIVFSQAWLQTGNAIGGASFLGSTNNQPLNIRTTGTQRMIVNANLTSATTIAATPQNKMVS